MALNIKPLGDRILVEPVEEKEVKKGGIIIPDTAKEKPVEARVVDARTGALRPEVPLCGGGVTNNCVATYNIAGNDPLRMGIDSSIRSFIDTLPLPKPPAG